MAVVRLGEQADVFGIVQLVLMVSMSLGFAALAWPVLRYPAVESDGSELSWVVPGMLRPRRIRLDDVTGWRRQDSFDLRLMTRDGREHTIRVPARLRERLERALSGTFGQAALAFSNRSTRRLSS